MKSTAGSQTGILNFSLLALSRYPAPPPSLSLSLSLSLSECPNQNVLVGNKLNVRCIFFPLDNLKVVIDLNKTNHWLLQSIHTIDKQEKSRIYV